MTIKYHSLISFLEVSIKPYIDDKWYGEIKRFSYGRGWRPTCGTAAVDTPEEAFRLINIELQHLLKEEFDNGR